MVAQRTGDDGSGMPDSETHAPRVGCATAATLLLLLPAFWNRFPLLEYDTGGYLARWFEGYLVPSRSTTYGLFLAAGAPMHFWPILLLQAAATVWIVHLVLRVHGFNVRAGGFLAIVATLGLTTALPFLASELLTDIFAGLAVLGLHVLVWHGERIARRERLALVGLTGFAASTHSATYAVLLALALLGLIVALAREATAPRRGMARATAALALGAGLLLAGNYVVAGKIAWTPGGYGIAFGRMLQDGIVTRYLDDHCATVPFKLCPYRHALPRDADDFLWGDSLFDKLGRFAGLGDEMRTIVLGSLHDYPALQIKAALVATVRQLFAVGTGEGVVDSTWHTYGIIERYTPEAAPAMHAARQQHGEIHFRLINDIHKPVAWAAMALLPAIVVLGLWSADFADLGLLAATITLALLANAAFCGVISNPHDRYGSRMVWIGAFAVTLAACRAFALLREQIMIAEGETA